MTHIIILGSGFGALTAVKEIRKAKVEAQITVVSPSNHLTYLPSLIWMPDDFYGDRRHLHLMPPE